MLKFILIFIIKSYSRNKKLYGMLNFINEQLIIEISDFKEQNLYKIKNLPFLEFLKSNTIKNFNTSDTSDDNDINWFINNIIYLDNDLLSIFNHYTYELQLIHDLIYFKQKFYNSAETNLYIFCFKCQFSDFVKKNFFTLNEVLELNLKCNCYYISSDNINNTNNNNHTNNNNNNTNNKNTTNNTNINNFTDYYYKVSTRLNKNGTFSYFICFNMEYKFNLIDIISFCGIISHVEGIYFLNENFNTERVLSEITILNYYNIDIESVYGNHNNSYINNFISIDDWPFNDEFFCMVKYFTKEYKIFGSEEGHFYNSNTISVDELVHYYDNYYKYFKKCIVILEN